MGILKEPASMVKALPLPAGFSVCELGDQFVSGLTPKPAREFYQRLGCSRYVAIDGNGKGTVTADLNLPLTPLKLGTFDLVTDFGTGEHVFDQAQVWRTIHELTKPGGYIAFDRPHQGYTKHCFYLVTESLLLDLAEANGYIVTKLKRTETERGWLIRGVFQRPYAPAGFRYPQQGRYQTTLRLPVARVS